MKIKSKIQNLVSPLYNKVWHDPKGRLTAKIKKVCDEMPNKQRVTVVTIMITTFVVTAFFIYGNACYKMGERSIYEKDSKFLDYIITSERISETGKELLDTYTNVPKSDITTSKAEAYKAIIEDEGETMQLDSVPYEAD